MIACILEGWRELLADEGGYKQDSVDGKTILPPAELKYNIRELSKMASATHFPNFRREIMVVDRLEHLRMLLLQENERRRETLLLSADSPRRADA